MILVFAGFMNQQSGPDANGHQNELSDPTRIDIYSKANAFHFYTLRLSNVNDCDDIARNENKL